MKELIPQLKICRGTSTRAHYKSSITLGRDKPLSQCVSRTVLRRTRKDFRLCLTAELADQGCSSGRRSGAWSSKSARCDDLMCFCSVSRVKQWRYGLLIGAIQEAANTRRDPFWCLLVSYRTWDANIIYSEKSKLANDLSGSQPNTTEFERSRIRSRSVKLWKLKSKALQIVIIQLVNYGGDLVGYDKSGGQNASTPSRLFSCVSKLWKLSCTITALCPFVTQLATLAVTSRSFLTMNWCPAPSNSRPC